MKHVFAQQTLFFHGTDGYKKNAQKACRVLDKDSQVPIILNTQYSILNTQYSILNTQYSILNTQYRHKNSHPCEFLCCTFRTRNVRKCGSYRLPAGTSVYPCAGHKVVCPAGKYSNNFRNEHMKKYVCINSNAQRSFLV